MATMIVFETHALSEDNERGVASGWAHSRLSERGRRLAEELGERRRRDGIAAVFSSDLCRAVETTAIAFPPGTLPVLLDWRLRECDYGDRNGASADTHLRDRAGHLDEPYPGGESWRQAVARVARWLDDLTLRWSGKRVLVVGHVATRWALDHYLEGVPLETLVAADFAWQEGWEYQVSQSRQARRPSSQADPDPGRPWPGPGSEDRAGADGIHHLGGVRVRVRVGARAGSDPTRPADAFGDCLANDPSARHRHSPDTHRSGGVTC